MIVARPVQPRTSTSTSPGRRHAIDGQTPAHCNGSHLRDGGRASDRCAPSDAQDGLPTPSRLVGCPADPRVRAVRDHGGNRAHAARARAALSPGHGAAPPRRWSAALNIAGLALSSTLFLAGAAVTALWIPNAFWHTAAGFAGGCLLGLVGLRLTRWQPGHGSLHYTPNALARAPDHLVVAARLAFRILAELARLARRPGLHVLGRRVGLLAGSLAAGAVVLGAHDLPTGSARAGRLRRHT